MEDPEYARLVTPIYQKFGDFKIVTTPISRGSLHQLIILDADGGELGGLAFIITDRNMSKTDSDKRLLTEAQQFLNVNFVPPQSRERKTMTAGSITK